MQIQKFVLLRLEKEIAETKVNLARATDKIRLVKNTDSHVVLKSILPSSGVLGNCRDLHTD